MKRRPFLRGVHMKGAFHKMRRGVQTVPVQLGQIGKLRDGMQVRRRENVVDKRPVIFAVGKQGVIGTFQGHVRQRRSQQILPVALASAAVVRQVDDKIRTVRGGVVEFPDGFRVLLIIGVVIWQKAVHFQVSRSCFRHQEGMEIFLLAAL